MANHHPDTNPPNDPDIGKKLDLLIEKIKAESPNLVNQTLPEPTPAGSENTGSTGMNPSEKPVRTKPRNSASPVPTSQTNAENMKSCADTTNPPPSESTCNNHHATPSMPDIELPINPLPNSTSVPLDEQKFPSGKDQAQIEALDELLADQAEQAVQADQQNVFIQMTDPNQVKEYQTELGSGQEEKGINGSCNSPQGTTAEEHKNQITGHFENNTETAQPYPGELHEKTDCDNSDNHQVPTTQPGLKLRKQGHLNGMKMLVNLTAINHACQMINQPVAPLTPSTRNLIGIVGLITLFNGSICCFYGIAKIIF